MLRAVIAQVVEGQNLSQAEAKAAMGVIMSGEATSSQIGAFITAMRMKGETVEEITGCAQAMREHAYGIRPNVEMLVDTCGTGGDGANTFNISTAAAFAVAGAGVTVAKHGNRSVSSKCGSADVLEALGVTIDLDPSRVESCIEEVGIGFLFAPQFHASMKHAAGPRKEIGIRTLFNVLGPLTNPASAHVQVVGVYDAALTHPVAEVLGRLGVQQAFVVHGLDRLDEISICGATQISHLRAGSVETYEFHPGQVGMNTASADAIRGGDAQENAALIRRILEGEAGPHRDIVLLNAGAALLVAGKANDLREGTERAAESIDSGEALQRLDLLIKYTRGAAA